MDFITTLQANPLMYYILIGLFSLCIGSFLNVVIYRFPKMLYRNWEEDCIETLNIPPETIPERTEAITLSRPSSHCPKCTAKIRWFENIPVLSYLFLRGRCGHCHEKISFRYPAIEILTAILSVIIAIYFGVTWQAFFAMLFTWLLITATLIDIDHQLLPDSITYILLWMGLLISLESVFVDTRSAVIGAAAGYLSLWAFAKLFKAITGKEGMGYGDFKLFAALGAWFGWLVLPFIIIIGSLVGAIISASILGFFKLGRDTPLPFGPYLALAGWLALFFGHDVTHWYMDIAGLL